MPFGKRKRSVTVVGSDVSIDDSEIQEVNSIAIEDEEEDGGEKENEVSENLADPISECSALCTSPYEIRDDAEEEQRALDDDIFSEFDSPSRAGGSQPVGGNSQAEQLELEDDSPTRDDQRIATCFSRQLDRILRRREPQPGPQDGGEDPAERSFTAKVLWMRMAYSFAIVGCDSGVTLMMDSKMAASMVPGTMLRVRDTGFGVELGTDRAVLFCGEGDVKALL